MHDIEYENFFIDVGYLVLRKCTPAWKVVKAQTDFVDLTYVIEGKAEYIIDGVYYHPGAGDLVCIPKGSMREAFPIPDALMKCFSINFQIVDLAGNDISLPFPPVFPVGIRPDIIALYEDLNNEWLCRAPAYRVKVRGMIMLILHRYLELILFKKDPENLDGRIKRVTRYLVDHYDEPLRLNEFAHQYNVTPAHFGCVFKKTMGMSFHQYLLDIRLNNAENMLRTGDHSVGEVASLCGFQDIAYFSKEFKKSRGISPVKLIGQEVDYYISMQPRRPASRDEYMGGEV